MGDFFKGAGGSLIGGIGGLIGTIANIANQRAARKQAAEQFDRQMKWTQQQYYDQKEFAYDMYDLQNYEWRRRFEIENNQEQRVARMLAAGLNPYLTDASAQGVTSAPQPSTPGLPSSGLPNQNVPNPIPIEAGSVATSVLGFANAASALARAKKEESESNLVDIEVKFKAQEICSEIARNIANATDMSYDAAYKKVMLEFAPRLFGKDLEIKESQALLNKSQAAYTKAQSGLVELQQEYQRITNKYLPRQIGLQLMNLEEDVKVKKSIQKKNYAEAGYYAAQKLLSTRESALMNYSKEQLVEMLSARVSIAKSQSDSANAAARTKQANAAAVESTPEVLREGGAIDRGVDIGVKAIGSVVDVFSAINGTRKLKAFLKGAEEGFKDKKRSSRTVKSVIDDDGFERPVSTVDTEVHEYRE